MIQIIFVILLVSVLTACTIGSELHLTFVASIARPVANDCLITYHSHNRLPQITNKVSCGAYVILSYVRDNYFPIAHLEREKCVLVTNCLVSGVNVTREKSKYFSEVRKLQNFLYAYSCIKNSLT